MTDEELKQRASEFVEKNWEDVVADIDSLVRINSVEDLDHAEPGKPYGPAPFEALDTAVKIAARLGLDAHNCDGHIGYADVPGASPKQIATIGHTDIVPAGTGWTFEPFKVTRKDGYLIGRGVLDDKGPTTLSLYAAKFFADLARETGERLPYTLRCIIGNNEETEMADVEWYLDNFDQPEFLFSPDADFPLIYGEKGGWSATVTSKPVSDVIVDFQGGTVGWRASRPTASAPMRPCRRARSTPSVFSSTTCCRTTCAPRARRTSSSSRGWSLAPRTARPWASRARTSTSTP